MPGQRCALPCTPTETDSQTLFTAGKRRCVHQPECRWRRSGQMMETWIAATSRMQSLVVELLPTSFQTSSVRAWRDQDDDGLRRIITSQLWMQVWQLHSGSSRSPACRPCVIDRVIQPAPCLQCWLQQLGLGSRWICVGFNQCQI